MDGRSGEKWGWTGGWLGGFVWLALLAIVFLFQGRMAAGISGLALFAAAAVAIRVLAPWRHPTTPYWRLMLPIYGMFGAAVGWAFWAFDGEQGVDLVSWDMLWLLLLLIPFGSVGRRRWSDGGNQPQA